MTIETSMFEPIKEVIGMGAKYVEYENLMAWMLNYLIEHDLPIETPIALKYNHAEMTEAGYLIKHDDKLYSLSPKAIVILYEWAVKNDLFKPLKIKRGGTSTIC